jgi:predicted O-methyltransferase YrrM
MELTGPRRAAVLAAYAGERPGTRVRVRGRWTTAPFEAVEALVPRSGDVLDLGCGIGVAALDLALGSADRRILAVDVDPSKTEVARRAVRRAGVADQVTVQDVPSGWTPPTAAFDAVLVVDVLYLLGRRPAFDLLDVLVGSLRPGGVLVVKEMAATPRWKAAWTRAQEQLAVRGLRATAGATVELVPTEDLAAHLEGQGLAVRTVAMDRGHLHPHQALVAGPAPGPREV